MPRFKRRQLLLHPNTRVQHPASTRKHTQHRRDTGTETEKPTRFSMGTQPKDEKKYRPRTTSIDKEKGGERIKSPRHDRAIFRTAEQSHQDVQNPRDRYPLITTHRHTTPRRSRLPSLQSRQNLLGPLPARRDKRGQHQTEKPR